MKVYSRTFLNGMIFFESSEIHFKNGTANIPDEAKARRLAAMEDYDLNPVVKPEPKPSLFDDAYRKGAAHIQNGMISTEDEITVKRYHDEAMEIVERHTGHPEKQSPSSRGAYDKVAHKPHIINNVKMEPFDEDIIISPENYSPETLTMAHVQHRRQTGEGGELLRIKDAKNAESFTLAKRIGIFLQTSVNYSGGRIHLYEYAHAAAAQLGAEVFLITDKYPKWAADFPSCDRMHLIFDEQGDKIPDDLDRIMSDGKGKYGQRALKWKLKHKHVPLFCLSFETANWVANYRKEYSNRLGESRGILCDADFLVSNSKTGIPFLKEWVTNPDAVCGVLPPVVNDYALERALTKDIHVDLPKHPYVVWSARKAAYKGYDEAVEAIWSYDKPLDLVVFGMIGRNPGATSLHRCYDYGGMPDVYKYHLMRHAHAVIAPSKFEGWGMVPAESIASGTPCVVYDLPVLQEAYGKRKGMIYVKWGDTKAFKEKLHKVISEPKIKITPKEILKTHGMKVMAKNIEKLPHHKFTKRFVSAQMITYWGFCPESIEAVYKDVDEILIAYGRVPSAEKIDDGSLERLEAISDPDNKIKIFKKANWKNKTQMRRLLATKASGNYMMMLDSDEIWVNLDKWLRSGVQFGQPRWLNFWHDKKHWIHDYDKMKGVRWGKRMKPFGSSCPHYRCSYWRGSFQFRHHTEVIDANKRNMNSHDLTYAKRIKDCVIYHIGHALPEEVMVAKHKFYLKRDGDDAARRKRRDTWMDWNGKTGDCGDGIICKVDWKLPKIVEKAFKTMGEW